MAIHYDKNYEVFVDEDTHLTDKYKNGLYAKIKRFNLVIPYNSFLSNRFVLNNVEDIRQIEREAKKNDRKEEIKIHSNI